MSTSTERPTKHRIPFTLSSELYHRLLDYVYVETKRRGKSVKLVEVGRAALEKYLDAAEREAAR